jgi:hypothetical protein
VTAMTAFAFGTAKIRGLKDQFVVVSCPHCQGLHAHARSSIGSREVLAGCHRPNQPRSYAIPERKPR